MSYGCTILYVTDLNIIDGGKQMKVVCIGDSLTKGYGVRETEVWVSLFKNKQNIEVINEGINGDSTDGMRYRFHRDVVEYKPTHAIIMGGSNDLIMGLPIDVVISNISSMVKDSLEYNIFPIIGIQPPIDPEMANKYWSATTNFYKVNKEIQIYRDWVIGYVDEKIGCIDFHNGIVEYLNMSNKREVFIDGVHLTPKGHELMAKRIPILS